MKKIVTMVICILFLLPAGVLLFSGTLGSDASNTRADAFFETVQEPEREPHKKADGSPYTVCYVDIDPYPASGEMLYYLLKDLFDRGWLTIEGVSDFAELPFDPADTDAGVLIDLLAQKSAGSPIAFSEKYNYYIALDDEEQVKKEILEGIEKKEIDLILCLGTWPGELVIKDLRVTEVPVMVYFSVDPVSAGLSYTQEYSGQDNVWCHTSMEVYKNQLTFYHSAYPFTKIGMVYYSESVAAMHMYRSAAQSLGVALSGWQIPTLTAGESEDAYYERLLTEYRNMIEKEGIDAFLLNTDMIKDPDRVTEMLEPFYEAGIPVFVQNGAFFVENGALMLMSASDAASQAPFAGDAMLSIFDGETPGSIYQTFVPSPYVSVNLDIAARIGYEVPQEILRSAERIYVGETE